MAYFFVRVCVQELIQHYMMDADGLAHQLLVPCPRVNMPRTVGLSYKSVHLDLHM